MDNNDYKILSPSIPHLPGVYRFLDSDGTILYVGKAKDLKKRLASYFGEKEHQQFKTKIMVRNASYIEFTIVNSEHDALLLENTLIKEHQPRYNVNLKDGKSYTYICIKNERFPRIFFTRKVIRDGSTYFGPYTSKFRTQIILDLIKKLFPLRTCNFQLSSENIQKKKFKVCLEYHIKNCQGPCEGLESEESYNKKIEQIKNILRGNFRPVKEYIHSEMDRLSSSLQFEEAHHMKENLDVFEDYQAKSTVVSATIKDLDVFSIADDEKTAFVNYIKIVDGTVVHSETLEFDKNLDELPEDILSYAIPVIREKYNSIAQEIAVPIDVLLEDQELTLTIPVRGDKKKVLELSLKNANYVMLQKKKKEASQTKQEKSTERILTTLKNDLNMDQLPVHIECFDNSNIQGTNPVSSCVVFKNGVPSKRDYRHFKVKTVVGPNDFASMEEVVYRRYKRLIEENESLPQLIIIDGGKGQLSSAMKSIDELGIRDEVTVIGIAKKLEEIFFPEDSIPLYINKKSESLKLIQHARNEAHRFAITFHRDQRSKNFIDSELLLIPGVGDKTAEKLLKHFGSTTKIKEASLGDLSKFVPFKKAKLILETLNKSSDVDNPK
ncbi:MAG: excinuclease ABC subunit UvrC [Saprospiraceae bacterium]